MTTLAAPVWRCLSHEGNEHCTADSLCFDCADLLHRARAAAGNCPPDCRECKFATLQLGAKIGLDTRGRKVSPVPDSWDNSWERGIPLDHCGMPFLDANHKVMGQKAVAEHRHEIDTTMRHWNAAKAAGTNGSN